MTEKMIQLLITGIGETLYMVVISTVAAYDCFLLGTL